MRSKIQGLPLKQYWRCLPVLGLLVAFFWSLPREWAELTNLYINNGDVRQHIWPLWRYYDQSLLVDDYIADYFLAMMPNGFQYAYAAVFSHVISPPVFSKLMSVFQFALTGLFACLAARRLGGYWPALCTLALFLAADTFMEWSSGGLPRGFGFLLVAACYYGLVANRPLFLATLPPLAALLYPPAAILTGAAFAAFCLAHPLWSTNSSANASAIRRQWIHRLTLLAASGALTLAAALPVKLALDDYGPSIDVTDSAQVQLFPERLERHPPTLSRYVTFDKLGEGLYRYSKHSYSGSPALVPPLKRMARGKPARTGLYVILGLVLAGSVVLCMRRPAYRALLVLPVCMLLVFCAAVVMYPLLYYPQRYIIFALPLLLVIATPLCIAAVAKPGGRPAETLANIAAIAGTLLIVVFLGGQASLLKESKEVAKPEHAPLYDYLRAQDNDILVAGWPKGAVEAVPYLTGRRILLSFETHLSFNEGYVLILRERMNALIRALACTDPRWLFELRDNWGVTHLMLRDSKLRRNARLNYFDSFDALIDGARNRRERSGLASLVEKYPDITAASVRGYRVIDLRRLPASALQQRPETKPPAACR